MSKGTIARAIAYVAVCQQDAIENPEGWSGYGENVWGLTACDGPGHFKLVVNGREREFRGYSARGPFERDDGTIAPTAALAEKLRPVLLLQVLWPPRQAQQRAAMVAETYDILSNLGRNFGGIKLKGG